MLFIVTQSINYKKVKLYKIDRKFIKLINKKKN